MYQYQRLAILLRGGGDIATGIALRLYRSGFRNLIILETPRPLAVRRRVAFSEAVYEGLCTVEGVSAALAATLDEITPLWDAGCIPVLVDPQGVNIPRLRPEVIIEATLAKRNIGVTITDAPLVIGVGPGFTVGKDVHRIVETNRGHDLGRVLYGGSAAPDTGIPGDIAGMTTERVLRAPQTGLFVTRHDIGDHVKAGDVIATVEADGVAKEVRTVIGGVIRGLLRSGTPVADKVKVGDVDPRENTACHHVSDKALAIGGGVLGAILGRFNRTCHIRRGILHCPVDKHAASA